MVPRRKMNVYKEYKPVRNRIAALERNDALAVIWAYCQYLQIDDFKFPQDIQVERKFLQLDIPQKWISEWELELLAKEVILNSGVIASKGRSLRKWDVLSEIINAIKNLEGRIYRAFGSEEKALVELIRIAHRQFIWQANPPNSASIIRYYKIFNRSLIDEICVERVGLTVWQIYMSGVAFMGNFLTHPTVKYPFKSDIDALPPEVLEKFLSFTSIGLADLRFKLKEDQRFSENFAYAYNSLRAYPLIRAMYRGEDSIVCPLMTLLFWRFTAGLYYELMADPRFANEFGDGFQSYVGEVITSACRSSNFQKIAECEYKVGNQTKRTVDWILADRESAFFIECKSKRLSWDAKASLSDLKPLEADVDTMAASIVQIYKTFTDYENNLYPNFPVEQGRKTFLGVVAPENWRMFGPVMLNALAASVSKRLAEANLSQELTEQHPYSVWAIEELETGLQIVNSVGIAPFIEGKLKDREMREWDWHGYMTHCFPKQFPLKRLFNKDYDEMFSKLFAAQRGAARTSPTRGN
jgi:hypothetical protein